MEHQHRLRQLRAVMSELSSAQTSLVFCVERMNELLASDDWHEFQASTHLPIADGSQFAVHWRDKTCFLGDTKPYHLFEHMLRRVDEYVTPQALLRFTWMGDSREPATIRSAVRELKVKLCRAKMKRLANAIRCAHGSYGLMLKLSGLR